MLANYGKYGSIPQADFNGSDSFTYYASDGLATSNAAIVHIAVASVNDAPSFVKGPDQHATDESGPQTIPGWATSIMPGPSNESGQALHFLITTDQAGLFAAGPSVSPAGELTFTPAANASGTATVLIALIDDGGTARQCEATRKGKYHARREVIVTRSGSWLCAA